MEVKAVSFKGWRMRDAATLRGKIVYFGFSEREATYVLEREE